MSYVEYSLNIVVAINALGQISRERSAIRVCEPDAGCNALDLLGALGGDSFVGVFVDVVLVERADLYSSAGSNDVMSAPDVNQQDQL